MVMGGPGFEAMSRLNIYGLALAVLAAVVPCSFKVSGRGVWHEGEGSDDRREHACAFVDAFVVFPQVAMFRKSAGAVTPKSVDFLCLILRTLPRPSIFDYVE